MLDKTDHEAAQPAIARPAQAPLPPAYTYLSRHVVLPKATHDETAQMNFLINLVSHLGSKVAPCMAAVYERRVAPEFMVQHGRPCRESTEVRDAMLRDPIYQTWAALRRNSQEARQQIGRAMTFRQVEQVNASARALNAGSDKLKLDPKVEIPAYVAEVDNHCAPGGYIAEIASDDVSAGANYESGHFVVAGGSTGGKSDMLGRSLAAFVKTEFPNLNPRRIVDVGAGGGFNTLPIAVAFPDAEVIALDVAAPMLRYGHARAKAMGVNNVTFLQANAESLPFEPGSVDMVVTAMLWHETALSPFRRMLAQIHKVLRAGGLALNFEQPNFEPNTPVFERFMRDWDCWYNAEPFWAKLHTLSFRDEMISSGFKPEAVFERWAEKVMEPGAYPEWVQPVNRHDAEHKLINTRNAGDAEKSAPAKRGPLYFFGALK